MVTRILPPTADNVALAAEALRRGELVGMPTETVYGLAAVAFDERAVAAVFAAKARPTFDPLIVHVAADPGTAGEDVLESLGAAGLVDLDALTALALARAARLAGSFWPGPLTLVLPKDPAVPDLVTSGLPTVAVRVPRHPVARALIVATGRPIAAPSANRFGRISPTSAGDVVRELSGRVAIVLDGGPCEVGLESSVVAVGGDGSLTLLRPGGVSREEIARVTGAAVAIADRAAGLGAQASPGMLDSHYAPAKPLHLLRGPVASLAREDAEAARALVPAAAAAGVLVASGDAAGAAAAFERLTRRRAIARSLSVSRDPAEAARGFFAALRALDASEAVVLFAEPWDDDEGIGHAISDRLRRAAARAERG